MEPTNENITETRAVATSDLYGDGSVKIHSPRQEVLMVDATPDEDYPLRILRAYLENATATRVESNPPALGEMMNKWQDERAVILRRAIERLSSPNIAGEPRAKRVGSDRSLDRPNF